MIIGIHKDRDKPHWADYVLATAYETLDSEKCGKCGVPAWHAFSENSAVAFSIDEHTCHSCAHKEQSDKKMKKSDEKPGVTRFVKVVPEDGFDDLPTRRDFQVEMLAKVLKEATEQEA